jgi:hypothetical protein
MKATKSLTYGTRRLVAGDIFTARTATDARVLAALKQAEAYSPSKPQQATPQAPPQPQAAPKPKVAAKRKLAAKAERKAPTAAKTKPA